MITGGSSLQRSTCLEKVVTNSEQSGITMSACETNAQTGIADWLSPGPYSQWKLQGYKCVIGPYTPKRAAQASRVAISHDIILTRPIRPGLSPVS
ncbi:hypothetical protein ACVWXM_006669 [Bradyrhizobium sp. GM7.3]